MTYAYFPGCSLHGLATEYDRSARAVCQKLNVGIEEAPNWVCCGATPAHATSHVLAVSLPAVTLDEVWKARDRFAPADGGAPTVMAACAACYARLRTANHEIRESSEMRAKVQKAAEVSYDGGVEVRHLLDILFNDIGVDAVKERVTRPLAGMKIACYYGCLLARPPKVVAFDDPENPVLMDRLLEAAGAECVEWPYKTECCGSSFALARPDIVYKLTNDILREAQDAGADAIATACPLCQSNLDLQQQDTEKRYNAQYGMPIFYFTQLLGLALGVDQKELGMQRLIVSPERVLASR